jgi:hypothetical protein
MQNEIAQQLEDITKVAQLKLVNTDSSGGLEQLRSFVKTLSARVEDIDNQGRADSHTTYYLIMTILLIQSTIIFPIALSHHIPERSYSLPKASPPYMTQRCDKR